MQVPDHMQIVITDMEKKESLFFVKMKGVTDLGKVSIAQLWALKRKKRKHALSSAGLSLWIIQTSLG